MIVVDDLKPWIGPHGFAAAHTPALDGLAEQGLIFRNAYCAAPACSPSRAAVFTGMAPHVSGTYKNRHNWRKLKPRATTIPRALQAAGYFTAGFGKLFHTRTHDDKGAWNERHHHSLYKIPDAPRNCPESIYLKAGSRFDWAALDVPVSAMDDHKQVDRAIATMQRTSDRPWFVACGIFRPHLPWYVPKQFFDLNPLDRVPLPQVLDNDLNDVPELGRKMTFKEEHRVIVANNLWRPAVQAYLASISYADFEVGRLLDGTPQDTVVILWSDHGWHLGPKNHWHKYTLWEEATQSVLAMVGPGVPGGAQCHRTVSLNDIYPTICELAGITAPHRLSGRSLLPLVTSPTAAWPHPALSTYGANNHSVRSEQYRYIRYRDGSEELYDHEVDPNEWTNLARRPDMAEVIAAHKEHLPRKNAKMTPREHKHRPEKRPRKRPKKRGRRQNRAWLELPDGRRALWDETMA